LDTLVERNLRLPVRFFASHNFPASMEVDFADFSQRHNNQLHFSSLDEQYADKAQVANCQTRIKQMRHFC